jgi:uncharacterized protein YecT (DUF1311 family)
MKIITLALLIFIEACNIASAEQVNSFPEGSAMANAYIYADNRDYFEKLLDAKNKQLVQLVIESHTEYPEPRLVAAIESIHKSWLQFRDAECELMGTLTGAGGAWPSTHATRCDANLTHRRFLTVKSAIKCIQRISPEKREFNVNACLYQLGTLTLGK